jgi:sulfopyruvate decarboxylase TPP-binding subunit
MEPKLAKRIVNGLSEAGIDFVTYLPETRLSQILPLMREDSSFQLAPVASEAEAVTIAAGAVLGGKQAACYIESTGIYVSCYSLVVIGKQLGVPILLVVGFLGGFADQRNSFLYSTIGAHAVPVLEALSIPHEVIESGDGLETKIKNAVRSMNALRSPAALVFAGDFTV